MTIRERDEMVTTPERALELLVWGRFGGNRSQMRLFVPASGAEPYIAIDHYGGHYDVWSSRDEYRTTSQVVATLRGEGLVEGCERWGYRDQHEFKASGWGEKVYFDRKEAARQQARGALARAVFWWLGALVMLAAYGCGGDTAVVPESLWIPPDGWQEVGQTGAPFVRMSPGDPWTDDCEHSVLLPNGNVTCPEPGGVEYIRAGEDGDHIEYIRADLVELMQRLEEER